MRAIAPAALSAMLAACAAGSAKPARGPDGEDDWYEVSCRRSKANCWDKASEVCPGGWVAADQDSQRGALVMGEQSGTYGHGRFDSSYSGVVLPIYNGEMLIKCRSHADLEESAPAPPPTKNLETCGRAYDHIDQLADAWVEWHPDREPVGSAPTRVAFLAVCGDLPEDAQVCLAMPYARTHRETCATTFEALPKREAYRLDALFLRRATASPVQPN